MIQKFIFISIAFQTLDNQSALHNGDHNENKTHTEVKTINIDNDYEHDDYCDNER